MISFISSFQICNFVIPDLKTYLWIVRSVPDTASGNPNGIKTLLANGLSTFFIKGKPFFSNGPRNLTKNPPGYPILDN